MEPPHVPGSDDVAGRPRLRWKYVWWHAWPAAPTRQDLRDFFFTQLLASALALLAGAAAFLFVLRGRFDLLPEVWDRAGTMVLVVLGAVVAYYAFVYIDWQRKRAA